MTDKIVVLSTCGSREEAEKLARILVEQRLAACVNVIPGVTSFYRWQGQLETSAEWLMLIKTSGERFEQLRLALEKTHSYDVPEVIAVPIVAGAPNYLNWIELNL